MNERMKKMKTSNRINKTNRQQTKPILMRTLIIINQLEPNILKKKKKNTADTACKRFYE